MVDEQKRVKESMEAGERLLATGGQAELNEEGEEIVEIKEDYSGEEQEAAERQPLTATPLRAPQPRAAASSVLSDAEFDAHWDRLAEMEEEEERREKEAKSSKRSPVSIEEAEAPVALPAIRSPADIYHNIKARKELHQPSSHPAAPLSASPQPSLPEPPPMKKRVSFSSQPSVALIDPVSTRPLRHHTHSPPPPAASLLPHSPTSPSVLDEDFDEEVDPPSSTALPPSSNPALLAAFSGAVRERQDEAPTMVRSVAAAGPTRSAPAAAPKKMSRFMAERLGIPFEE